MPNSILWVGLVVLWVFVLFPMLADRHPRIRRTTDAALSTRVLYRGGTKRRMAKGPAAGHESDPDWVPTRVQRKLFGSSSDGHDAEDRMTTSADDTVIEYDESVPEREPEEPDATESADADLDDELAVRDPDDEAEADDLDDGAGDLDEYDLDDDSDDEDSDREDPDDERDPVDDDVADRDADRSESADEVGTGHAAPAVARIPPAPAAAESAPPPEPDEFDSDDDEYVPSRRGRGGYDPESDAAARRLRYRFRQRTALGLALSALLFGAFAVAVAPMLWWGCALSVLTLGTYLVYLRRQVRMEEEIRYRRAARLARDECPDEYAATQASRDERVERDRDAARALRRRAVVLDIDDEDAAFDHLEAFDAAAARATRNRAAGSEIRRASGE